MAPRPYPTLGHAPAGASPMNPLQKLLFQLPEWMQPPTGGAAEGAPTFSTPMPPMLGDLASPEGTALRGPAGLFKTPGRNGTELMNGPPGPAPEVPIPTQLGMPPSPPPYGTDVRIPEGFNPAMPSAGISGKDAAKMLAATGGAGLLSALAYQAHQARANAPMGIPAIPKPTAIPKNENPVTDGANDPWLSQTKAHAQAALGPDTSPEQLQQVMQVLQAMNAMRPPR